MTSDKQTRRTDDLVVVGPDEIDASALIEFVTTPQCGAVSLFLGAVRDHSDGKEGVTHLEYEAYDDVVVQKIQRLGILPHPTLIHFLQIVVRPGGCRSAAGGGTRGA